TLTLFLVPQSADHLSNHVSYAGTKWLHCKMLRSPPRALAAAGAVVAAAAGALVGLAAVGALAPVVGATAGGVVGWGAAAGAVVGAAGAAAGLLQAAFRPSATKPPPRTPSSQRRVRIVDLTGEFSASTTHPTPFV